MTTVDLGLIVCRWLHFGAVMLCFGLELFRSTMASPTIWTLVSQRLTAIERMSSWLAIASGIAWLLLQGAEVDDGWQGSIDRATLTAVLWETQFGRVWLVHLVLGAVLVLLLTANARSRALAIAIAGLYAASLGWVGHPAMAQGLRGWISLTVFSLHLVAAAAWVGALPALSISMAAARGTEARQALGATVRRYSLIGHGTVAMTLLTGSIGAFLVLGRWPWPVNPYSVLLGFKIIAVSVMVLIAIVNRYLLVPRLKQNATGVLSAIEANTAMAGVIVLIVLALVGVFGTLQPTE